MNQILLAYCRDNADLAQTIERHLGRLGLPFEHLHDAPGDLPGQFANRLQNTDDGVVLLITHDFLRSRACMNGMLGALQQLNRRQTVQVVVADGKPGPDGTAESTHIDRMVHALQYMNYWQSEWLEYSDRHQHAAPEERERLNAEMNVVHDIANEMGDFIGALREVGYVTWEQFRNNDYAVFFRKFGLQEWHTQYRELATLDLAPERPSPPVAEAPAVTGLLAPRPTPPDEAREAVPAPPRQAAPPPPPPPLQEPIEDIHWGEDQSALPTPPPEEVETSREMELDTPIEAITATDADAELHQTIRDGWFWLENGHTAQGFELFQLALEQYPDHPELRAEYERARQQFGEHLASPEPVREEPVALRPETTTPGTALESAPPPDTPSEVQSYLQMGEDAVQRGDYLFAKFCWDRVAELNPNYPGIYHKLGVMTSEHLKDYKETALHYLRSAIQQDPNDAEAHFRVARVFREQFADDNAARQHLQHALQLNPLHAEAWFDLARLTLHQGQADQAADYYRQAVALHPDLRSSDFDRQFLAAPEAPATEPLRHPEERPLKPDAPEKPLYEEEWIIQPQPETETEAPRAEEETAYPGETILEEAIEVETEAPADHPRTDELPEFPVAPADALDMPVTSAENAPLPDAGAGLDTDWEEEEEEVTITAGEAEVPVETSPALEEAAHAIAAHEILPNEPYRPQEPQTEAAETEIAEVIEEEEELVDADFTTESYPQDSYDDAAPAWSPPAPETEAETIAASPADPTPAAPAEVLTILITGATSGIGRATAELFAAHGHRLILTGRRNERLDEVKARLEADHRNEVLTLPFDVRNAAEARSAFEQIPEAWQEIDVLINNAGLAKGLAPIHEGELEHWETMIDTNIKGLLYMTRLVSPGMVDRRRGHIINIGSAAGKEVYPQGNVYCATKFAVDSLTRSMRLDLYQHNIRVSQVSPGHVEETEFALTRFDGDADRARIYDDFQPLKASDVAEVIYFMATRPPHVNIQDVVLYGTQQGSTTHIDRSGRGDG